MGTITLQKAGYAKQNTGDVVATLKRLLEDQRLAWEKGWDRAIQNVQLDIQEIRDVLLRRNKRSVSRAMKRKALPLEIIYGNVPQAGAR